MKRLVAVWSLVGALAAQAPIPTDMMALPFTGDLVFFDSHTGAGYAGNRTGLTAINALARLGTTLHFFNRTGTATNPTFHFQAMTVQGAVFQQASNVGIDPRGLAAQPGNANRLLAIRNAAPDELLSFDRATRPGTSRPACWR